MFDHLQALVLSLLPWHRSFDATTLGFAALYVALQVIFCLSLRRMAMAIPGPLRMCSPIGLWVLVIPGVGALASFGVLRHVWDAATAATTVHHVTPPRGVARGFAMTYGFSRLLILLPGMLVPALVIQGAAAAGFLVRLASVARSLRTPDVAIA
ncbi:MAG TPA: hypothetical protein VE861_02290 [Gemmatimonadaceae bacterium]|nr:hypothetical protein [Gemmatimonadaceae bacterium]